MDSSAQGIILRLHPYSETSLIVRWLTRDAGRIATLARGGHRPKSPLRGRLDALFLADFSYTPSRRGNLHTLKEVSLNHTFPRLRQHYTALQQAAYAVRLIERTTETDTPLPGLFELLRSFLDVVSRRPDPPVHLLALELRLLDWAGQAPPLDSLKLSTGTRSIFTQLLQAPWDLMPRLRLSRSQFNEMDGQLAYWLQQEWSIPPQWRTALGIGG